MRIILLLILSLPFQFSIAQSPQTILDSLDGRSPETVFVHMDKKRYQPGETTWFKIYLLSKGLPAVSSTSAKVEIVNEQGTVVRSAILPVTAAAITGSFVLPAQLPYGYYLFRVLTQHMTDYVHPANQYEYIFPVVPAGIDLFDASPVTDITMRFYPEGGNFIEGEMNTLAFKVFDQLGRPASITGVIKDNSGKEVATFATEYNGMGRVELKPERGAQYTASYQLPSGVARAVKLPEAIAQGTNLVIIDEVIKKRMIVSSNDKSRKPAYILGEINQSLAFKTDIAFTANMVMLRVPVGNLPAGLLHVGVFTADHELLAERTTFVYPKKSTGPLYEVADKGLKARDQVKSFLSLPDSLEGNFSMAVIPLNQDHQQSVQNYNISESGLVFSNLEPAAQHPLYQLGPIDGATRNEAIDLLLLTHEYKWNWKRLKELTLLKPVPAPDYYITVTGNAFSDRSNKTLPESELQFVLRTKDSSTHFFAAKTDNTGAFIVPGLFFEDTATFYVKNNTQKNRDKKVELELTSSSLADRYHTYPRASTSSLRLLPGFLKLPASVTAKPPVAVAPAVLIDTTGEVMQEVIVQSRTKSPTQQLESRYVSGMFSGNARTTIDFITNKPTYMGGNIFDFLKGRYSYMQVMGNAPNYMLVYRNMRSLGSGSFIPMSLYLDEMPVDPSMLITVPMNDIAMVRIHSTGIMGTGGALAVYTKKGADASTNSYYSDMISFKITGYSSVPSFQAPDYTAIKKSRIKSDTRTTLFWKPDLIYLPEDGKLPLHFSNNDAGGGYKVVIQGVTSNGQLICIEQTINR